MKKLLCTVLAALAACSVAASAVEVTPYMTYRDNTVVFTAADGLNIQSGAFEVCELCVTSGQDPDGRNFVGQVLTLQNGEINFQVGRSPSADVAAWFNERFSGYNDPAVNGDRTTFDHTADKLSFAFVGDLTLTVTTPEYPQGVTVVFPKVGLAQGSTLFSNNWWFGQTTGQHTRDSDGPDRLLTMGVSGAGETVFASFLRGGNGTNEITLEEIKTAPPASGQAARATNVRERFQDLPAAGTRSDLYGFPGSYDPVVNHIQGYAQYEGTDGTRYALLSHSVGTADYAHIVAGPKFGDEKWGFKTYLKDWRHPGGIDTIGDYLVVPSESETDAHVALYDMRALAVGELRRVESFDLAVGHKAGALAITTYEDDGAAYYLLIVAHLNGEHSMYHVYRAPAEAGLENAAFTEVGSFGLEKDFQGFGLVTEEGTGDVYLIGLWSPGEGATFADFAYLYQLDTDAWTVGEPLEEAHLYSVGGGAGMMGVHFRYGASVYVEEDGNYTISATERNSVLGTALSTNDWTPA